ncbi:hypothetical protein [Edwardsiella tarda]|uniref:hypothetical protein n=1 Tax=Edwardsiella tarda TaxID=636 RepID=UPI0002DC2654|nr:hypothetical protein [Edwardsiella tarda]
MGFYNKARANFGTGLGVLDKARSLIQVWSALTPSVEMLHCRELIRKLMMIRFAQGWQWCVEADGMPPEFDMFVKDITYGGGTVETEPRQIGAGEFNKPTYRSSGTITMTVRDDEDMLIATWFDRQKAKITNPDGTINLPGEYLFTIRIYQLTQIGKVLDGEWAVMATQRGDCTRSRDQVSEFYSYTLTFTKYSSYGTFINTNSEDESAESGQTQQPIAMRNK